MLHSSFVRHLSQEEIHDAGVLEDEDDLSLLHSIVHPFLFVRSLSEHHLHASVSVTAKKDISTLLAPEGGVSSLPVVNTIH